MPLDADIRARLRAVVDRTRLPIAPRCRTLLDALIEVGVARAQADGADEVRLVEAEHRLRLLLDDMTQQSRILRFDALHEPTLVSALERQGRAWPFY